MSEKKNYTRCKCTSGYVHIGDSTRLEASLAELQGRVAAALMRLEEADGVGYTHLCEDAIAILRDESASGAPPTRAKALQTLEAD